MDPPDSQRTFSSVRTTDPEYHITCQSSRITAKEMSWCANIAQTNEWLQIDLGATKTVKAVLTAGGPLGYVENFELHQSLDGVTLFSVGSFTGTSQEKRHDLAIHLVTRYVRFVVQSWSSWPSLRAGVIICRSSILIVLAAKHKVLSSIALDGNIIVTQLHPAM